MSVRERGEPHWSAVASSLWPAGASNVSTLAASRAAARGHQLRGGGRNHSPSALYKPGAYTHPARPFRSEQHSDESLEIVWDGPKARLLRKLKMGAAGPEPDFALGADRAASTARRLGIGAQQQQQQRPFDPSGEPLSARSTSTRPTSRGRTPHGSAAPPAQRQPPEQYVGGGHAHVEPWLADHEFFEELGSKVREAKLYISRHGPEQARRATADLSATAPSSG